jgi:hypothetical protein
VFYAVPLLSASRKNPLHLGAAQGAVFAKQAKDTE